ncbi:MAG: hypothetical protein GY705_20405 [Bacteroidetes bacterium]|nr:hypothetical protein [Bacteroidota bacterium]
MSNRVRKCKQCGDKKRASDGIQTPVSWFCSTQCGFEYSRTLQQKMRNKQKKAVKEKNAKQKKTFMLSDTRHQHKLTQIVFNRLRVAEEKKWFTDRGLEPECISCGKTNMDWCCGHFKTRGSQGNLRYDKKNTFLQCNRYCNMFLSGNINGNKVTRGYQEGLKHRFGDTKALEIIKYCNETASPKKWTGEELAEMRKEFREKLKTYKSNN